MCSRCASIVVSTMGAFTGSSLFPRSAACSGAAAMAGVLSTSVAAAPPSVKRRRVAGKTSPWFLALLEDLGCEASGDPQVVYLGTVSRVLPGAAAGYRDLEAVTKAELSSMVRDAVDSPVGGGSTGGRPRTRTDSPVDFTIVVKEKHADGTSHFHFALKLNRDMRFGQAK